MKVRVALAAILCAHMALAAERNVCSYTDSHIVPHEDCDKFYLCSNGVPYEMNCPDDLLYDTDRQDCEWPYDVECGNRNVPDESGVGGGGGGAVTAEPEQPITTSVPETTVVIIETTSITPNEYGCPVDFEKEKILAHSNCHQFYKCTHGVPVEYTCASGTFYNPETERCDWPQKVDCGDRFVPEEIVNPPATETSSPTSAPEVSTEPEVTEDGNDPILFPNENGCPEDSSIDKLMAHENCNQFYKCTHGEPVAYTCASGTFYNPATERCDWPQKVDCGDRFVPEEIVNPPATETPSPTSAPEVSTEPEVTEDGNDPILFPNENGCPEDSSIDKLMAHENCNQFYKCTHGEPVAYTCASGTFYNPATERCDWPQKVDCGDRFVPEEIVNPPATETPSPTSAPEVTAEPEVTEDDNDPILFPNENGCPEDSSIDKLMAHENCNQFYKCTHGEPVAYTCASGTFYNPATGRCDWPQKVDCGDRFVPEEIVNPPATETPSPTSAPEVSTEPEVTEDDNDPILFPNENGCPEDSSIDKLMAHENCNQFYKCTHGEPVAYTCASGTFYNPETERCDWPQKVECGDRFVPEEIVNPPATETPSPTSAPEVSTEPEVTEDDNDPILFPNENGCPEDSSIDKLMAHENCNQFYKCTHGEPVAYTCASGTFYNPATERCDWPQKVDCGDRFVPEEIVNPPATETPSPTSAPEVTAEPEVTEDDNDPILFPNENGCPEDSSIDKLMAHENCNQFYKCTHGEPVAYTCASGTFYNPATERCDWPQKVDCGDRFVPEEIVNPPATETPSPTSAPEVSTEPEVTEDDNDPILFPNENGCPEDSSIDKLMAHENCNQFYKCTHGEPVAYTCASGTFYNPATERCDWPQKVDCGDRFVPEEIVNPPATETPSPTSAPEVTAEPEVTEDDNDPILFPNENGCPEDSSIDKLMAHENCNQFYKCTHGEPVAYTCASGTFYNPATERCDWPQKVDCGDRFVPEEIVNPPATETPSPTSAPEVSTEPEVTEDDNDPILFPNENGCPEDSSIDKLMAHENCNQFYKCTHGEPVAYTCASGTFYNPETERCDWPQKVECGDRFVPEEIVNPPATETPSPTSAPEVSTEPEVTEDDNDPILFPNENSCPEDSSIDKLMAHENCNQFYKCTHGEPVAYTCASGTFYNPATERCDWPQKVDCGDRFVPEEIVNPPATETPSPTSAPEVSTEPEVTEDDNDPILFPNENGCPEDSSIDKLMAHENCNQFYKCTHGEPVAYTCASGTFYNPETERCDWPQKVECGDRFVPEEIVNPPATETPSPTSAPEVSTEPEVTEDDNDPILFPNENGCPEDSSIDKLMAHENCNQFYKCTHGIPVEYTCVSGTFYNPETYRCDWLREVDCGDRKVPEEIVNPPATDNPDPTIPPFVTEPIINENGCPEDYTVEKLLPHENCNQFYICNHGKPVVFNCWPGTLYNPETLKCDWPEKVECGNRYVPGDNPPTLNPPAPTQLPEVTENDNDLILFPNENRCPENSNIEQILPHENCNQFYTCVNGELVTMNCWPGLLFNPDTIQCDWPHKVNCGNRIIPLNGVRKKLL